MQGFGLYVHIPFCKRKCNYCDFYSNATTSDEIARYFGALKKEIVLQGKKMESYKLDTVFFGGGTPSLVEGEYIAEVMQAVRDNFNCDISEATIECNPDSITDEKLSVYKTAGLNRISIGVQSLNDDILKVIGRVHDKATALASIETAKKYFDNVSVDVMLGLPNQTVADAIDTLSQIVDMGVEHISAYGLKLEEGTKLYLSEQKGEIKIDDDYTADIYDAVVDYLSKNDFDRYEISNFAKDGCISKHNLSYWQRKPYLGVGVAAYSFLDNKRFNNIRNTAKYISAINDGEIPFENLETLSVTDQIEEEIMLSLRTKFGLDLGYINEKYQIEFLTSRTHALNINADYITIVDNILHIKPQYFYISNSIISDLI